MDRRDELIEKGWQQMSEILDREMPQRKRRRRLLFWVPVGLIGLLALTYTTWASGVFDSDGSSNSVHDNTEQLEETRSREEILTENNAEKQPAASPDTMIETLAGEGALALSEITAENTRNSSNVKAKAREGSPLLSGLGSDRSLKNNELNTVVESDIRSLVRSDIPEQPDALHTPPNDETRILSTEVPSLLPSESRPAIPINYATSMAPAASSIPDNEVALIQPASLMFDRSFGLGAYVSSHWDKPVTLQGVEAGLLVSWNVAPRWSVSGGLAYGHHRKLGIADLAAKSSDDQELALNPNDPADTMSFGGVTTIDLSRVSYDTAESLVNKLNYLHIPFHVEYRATRGLSIRAGVRASYMLGAPVRQMSNVFIARPNVTNTVLLDTNTSPRLLVDEGVIRRWDVAPVIGISWDLNRLLAIDMQYQHGLLPYIDRDANDRSDFNRTLSLGLRVKML